MTEKERDVLYGVLKREAPEYYEKLRCRYERKKTMIAHCFRIASCSDNPDYQGEIKKVYYTSHSLLNDTELVLLNHICLIRHREHLNQGIDRDDADIQKWMRVIQCYRDNASLNDLNPVIGYLDRHAKRMINRYRIRNKVGRPKGTGKRIYIYKGKEYRTIQECADEFGISKQGMFQRLKKLQII